MATSLMVSFSYVPRFNSLKLLFLKIFLLKYLSKYVLNMIESVWCSLNSWCVVSKGLAQHLSPDLNLLWCSMIIFIKLILDHDFIAIFAHLNFEVSWLFIFQTNNSQWASQWWNCRSAYQGLRCCSFLSLFFFNIEKFSTSFLENFAYFFSLYEKHSVRISCHDVQSPFKNCIIGAEILKHCNLSMHFCSFTILLQLIM